MDGRSAPRSEIGDRDLARVRELYDKTLRYRDDDPEVALSQARKAAEAICKQIHRAEGLDAGGRPTTKMMLQELIQALRREGLLPRHIAMPLGTIQQYGNFGVHDQGADAEHITSEFIRPCVTALETVVERGAPSQKRLAQVLCGGMVLVCAGAGARQSDFAWHHSAPQCARERRGLH